MSSRYVLCSRRRNERAVMMVLDHPFLLRLHNTYRDDIRLYFLLELCMGGELFTALRLKGTFQDKEARFYAATVVLAFQDMHSKDICHRDLKPENLLLDDDGYLKMVDFGLAKKVVDRTWTLCGTPDYLAPEIILSKGHDKAVDLWALGVLIYEMVAGYTPFFSEDPMEVYQLILMHNLTFVPSMFSKHCKCVIQKLCQPKGVKRLGNMKKGYRDIFTHAWFSGFDWDGLLSRSLPPPIKTEMSHPEDTTNFDCFDDEEEEEAAPCTWDPEEF